MIALTRQEWNEISDSPIGTLKPTTIRKLMAAFRNYPSVQGTAPDYPDEPSISEIVELQSWL